MKCHFLRPAFVTLFLASTAILTSSCEPEAPTGTKPTEYQESYFTRSCGGVANNFTQVVVKDYGEGTGNREWTKNKIYILDGQVYVNPGQTLRIQAGTIIKGKSGSGDRASALIVARGGKIIAEGTQDEPIIFTAESDELARNNTGVLVCTTDNLTLNQRGLWGGLIILGAGQINSTAPEYVLKNLPTFEQRARYGGANDDDNSGTLRYVSVRHAGLTNSGRSFSGVTLAGVGRATTIDYLEVAASKTHGLQILGGTVGLSHVAIVRCGSEALTTTDGWRGQNQFWLIVQDDNSTGLIALDLRGGTDKETGEPFAIPTFWNLTAQGHNTDRAVVFSDNAGGHIYNSIFYSFKRAVHIELVDAPLSSYAQLAAGRIQFRNNILWDIPPANHFTVYDRNADDGITGNEVPPFLINHAQTFANSYFSTADNITNTNPDMLEHIPGNPSVWSTTTAPPPFQLAPYRGCFDATTGEKWTEYWTKGYVSGVL
jgi:hypothetical protein